MDFPRIDRQRYLPKYQVHFEHTIEGDVSGGKPQSLPAAEESSGTLRYLGLSTLLALLIQHPGVLCIDEIETSIHPELIKHFLLTFLENASHSQLILTTHHTALLDERDILRPDAIWLTQKRPDGATELYSVAEFNTAVLRKKSSIGNAYRIGKLGALPNPGSIFLDSNGNEGTGIVTVLM
jgi:AAA15 family ATPase/GTPase